ncbi:hypothetical protein NDU88_007465 [Pleurodeles waltl]|uniref:Uncharacterized protein n=1 Tax=Pleurodeles waltl TaxID=8319 RepID=A0AAV7WG97_PLEWA|nr:hypothetical protein NDU88_007465 [Pleurodeles waltl]
MAAILERGGRDGRDTKNGLKRARRRHLGALREGRERHKRRNRADPRLPSWSRERGRRASGPCKEQNTD